MITKQALQEAIAECQGERNPNAHTCMKLAAFYTIKNELFGKTEQPPTVPSYSFAPPPRTVENTITFESDTEFGRLVDGRDPLDVWPLVDELVSALAVVNPRLYNSFIRRLK